MEEEKMEEEKMEEDKMEEEKMEETEEVEGNEKKEEEAGRFECTSLQGRGEAPAEEHLHDRYVLPPPPCSPPPALTEPRNSNQSSYFRPLSPDWLIFESVQSFH